VSDPTAPDPAEVEAIANRWAEYFMLRLGYSPEPALRRQELEADVRQMRAFNAVVDRLGLGRRPAPPMATPEALELSGQDAEMVRLWRRGTRAPAIAAQLGLSPKRIYNRLGELRRARGSAVVPYRARRRKTG
jgi:DNA-binding CsgD family transcriptional regulator